MINPSDNFDRRLVLLRSRDSSGPFVPLTKCGETALNTGAQRKPMFADSSTFAGRSAGDWSSAARSNYPSINTDSRSVSAVPIRSSLSCLSAYVRPVNGRPLFPRASIHIRSSFVDRANRLLSSFAQIAHVSQLYAPLHCVLSIITRRLLRRTRARGLLSPTANVTSSRAGRSYSWRDGD